MITEKEKEWLEFCLAQKNMTEGEVIEFLKEKFPDCTIEKTEHTIDRMYRSTRVKKPVGDPVCIVDLPGEFKHTGSHRPYEGKSLNKHIQLWVMPLGKSVGYRYFS